MTDATVAITAAAFALEAIAMLVAAVWAVASVKSTTGRLGLSIDNLARVVSDLRASVKEMDTKIDDHAERLTRVEIKTGVS